MKFRKKPEVIEATQWFKNGDHPDDRPEQEGWEGTVVRYYRHPRGDGQDECKRCGDIMHNHGWIDDMEDGRIVCPGDWVITCEHGEYYPCKPAIFAATYEPQGEEYEK